MLGADVVESGCCDCEWAESVSWAMGRGKGVGAAFGWRCTGRAWTCMMEGGCAAYEGRIASMSPGLACIDSTRCLFRGEIRVGRGDLMRFDQPVQPGGVGAGAGAAVRG